MIEQPNAKGGIRRMLLRCGRNRATPAPVPNRPGMLTDPEVDYFALANYLIDNHGQDEAEANRLMNDAVRENDPLAATDWLTVGHAIALLTNDFAGARH